MADLHLQMVRAHALDLAVSALRPGIRLLELAGGNSNLAALLSTPSSSFGCMNIARCLGELLPPVKLYDGHRIPYRNDGCGTVLWLDALEHVARLGCMANRHTPAAHDHCAAQKTLPAPAAGSWRRFLRPLDDGPHGEHSSAVAEVCFCSWRRRLNVCAQARFRLIRNRACGNQHTVCALFPLLRLKTRLGLTTAMCPATGVHVHN